MDRRNFLGLGMAAVAAGASGCGTQGGPSRAGVPADGGTVIRYPVSQRPTVPAFGGELLDGGQFESASLRGFVTVLNFWASWCAPCRVEIPDLQAAQAATAAHGRVRFLGVNFRDDRDKAKAFLAASNVTYPSLFDPAGKIALAFHAIAPNPQPATVVIDAQDRVALVFRRAVRRDELIVAVNAVTAERPA